jgi:hypothetical protein
MTRTTQISKLWDSKTSIHCDFSPLIARTMVHSVLERDYDLMSFRFEQCNMYKVRISLLVFPSWNIV